MGLKTYYAPMYCVTELDVSAEEPKLKLKITHGPGRGASCIIYIVGESIGIEGESVFSPELQKILKVYAVQFVAQYIEQSMLDSFESGEESAGDSLADIVPSSPVILDEEEIEEEEEDDEDTPVLPRRRKRSTVRPAETDRRTMGCCRCVCCCCSDSNR